MIHSILEKSMDNSRDYLAGFADLAGLTQDPGLRYGLVIAKRLDDQVIDSIDQGPTFSYFNYYHQVNSHLSLVIHSIGDQLKALGYASKVVEPSIREKNSGDEYYRSTLRTPISHKMIATRAGLGWIGKTDLFVSKKFGPRVRLVSLLTNYPLPVSGKTIDRSRCGKCKVCVVNCPAQAATGQLWDIYTDRDVFFDAHRCRDTCMALTRERLHRESALCGICVSVCPAGKSNRDQ
ncbi:MAG: 4Fe-4S double cluster binding domain-containing protein [Bacteroidales bacterium]|jgi:ferredoxin|nr:4Fe-4S double cluster binding domain-containing protein [Bacteroidales bacterium]